MQKLQSSEIQRLTQLLIISEITTVSVAEKSQQLETGETPSVEMKTFQKVFTRGQALISIHLVAEKMVGKEKNPMGVGVYMIRKNLL